MKTSSVLYQKPLQHFQSRKPQNGLVIDRNTQFKIRMFVVIASATLHITISLSFMWFIFFFLKHFFAMHPFILSHKFKL